MYFSIADLKTSEFDTSVGVLHVRVDKEKENGSYSLSLQIVPKEGVKFTFADTLSSPDRIEVLALCKKEDLDAANKCGQAL